MTEVNENPLALNPLYEIESKQRPHLVEVAKAEAPAPTMWATGDLPPFTVSGLDPEMLRYVPWQARHAAAAEPDKAKVLRMIENNPDSLEQETTIQEHEGLAAYRQRVQRWLGGHDKPKNKDLTPAEQDELYETMFGKK